jgi:hypothetical protein
MVAANNGRFKIWSNYSGSGFDPPAPMSGDLHDVLNLWKPPLHESIFFEPLGCCRLFFLACWHAEWKQQQQDHSY